MPNDDKHIYIKVPLIKANHVNAKGQVFTEEALQKSSKQIEEWVTHKEGVFGEYYDDYKDHRGPTQAPTYVAYADNVVYEDACLYGNIALLQYDKGEEVYEKIEKLGGIAKVEIVPNLVIGSVSARGEVSNCILTSFSMIPKRERDEL